MHLTPLTAYPPLRPLLHPVTDADAVELLSPGGVRRLFHQPRIEERHGMVLADPPSLAHPLRNARRLSESAAAPVPAVHDRYGGADGRCRCELYCPSLPCVLVCVRAHAFCGNRVTVAAKLRANTRGKQP